MIKLMRGDCLKLMKDIPDKSIDMILCDLPYGTTACKWDSIIPFNDYIIIEGKKLNLDELLLYSFKKNQSYKDAVDFFHKNKKLGLWSHYNRIIKSEGAIILFGSEPFSTALRNSNMEMYKYDWIWQKNTVDGFFNSKCRPLKTIENISVFSKKQASAKGDNMVYYPQGLIQIDKKVINKRKNDGDGHNYHRNSLDNKEYIQKYTNYPTEILTFDRDVPKSHPTQKPVALLEYLIKTYTNDNETVLDNCMGSGSTGVACVNTNRNFIGMELDEKYFNIAKERIESYDRARETGNTFDE